jgi:hypothetical protein
MSVTIFPEMLLGGGGTMEVGPSWRKFVMMGAGNVLGGCILSWPLPVTALLLICHDVTFSALPCPPHPSRWAEISETMSKINLSFLKENNPVRYLVIEIIK